MRYVIWKKSFYIRIGRTRIIDSGACNLLVRWHGVREKVRKIINNWKGHPIILLLKFTCRSGLLKRTRKEWKKEGANLFFTRTLFILSWITFFFLFGGVIAVLAKRCRTGCGCWLRSFLLLALIAAAHRLSNFSVRY